MCQVKINLGVKQKERYAKKTSAHKIFTRTERVHEPRVNCQIPNVIENQKGVILQQLPQDNDEAAN